MKILFLILTVTLFAMAETAQPGFERARMEYRSDACEAAKTLARTGYEIVKLDPGCICEKTDGHLWQCDIRFTYSAKRPEPVKQQP